MGVSEENVIGGLKNEERTNHNPGLETNDVTNNQECNEIKVYMGNVQSLGVVWVNDCQWRASKELRNTEEEA